MSSPLENRHLRPPHWARRYWSLTQEPTRYASEDPVPDPSGASSSSGIRGQVKAGQTKAPALENAGDPISGQASFTLEPKRFDEHPIQPALR